jgi:hypothetical protein
MDKLCDYPKQYSKAIDTISHSIKQYIPLSVGDYDCEDCEVLNKQLACFILGDLLEKKIIVKDGK